VAARRTNAEFVLPAAAAPMYGHTPAFDIDDLGDKHLATRPIHAPGQRPEHISYLILIEDKPVALFSGGRTGWLGPNEVEESYEVARHDY